MRDFNVTRLVNINRTLWRKILDSLPEGVLVCAPSGQVRLCNDNARRLLGQRLAVQPDRVLVCVGDLFPTVEVAGVSKTAAELLQSVLWGGEEVGGEVRVRQEGGESTHLLLQMIPLTDGGVCQGVLLLLREVASPPSPTAAESPPPSPTQVIAWTASVAHEVRNPLAAIGNCIEILDKQLNLQGDSKELIEIALSECTRLDRVLGNILTFARRKEPVLQPIEVHALVERVLRAVQYDTRFHPAISLVRRFHAPAPLVLQLDQDQMSQVLWNLLINAVQAMPEGGELAFTTRIAENRWLVLSVRDSGIGMSPEVIEKALQPFFTTKTSGTGLGLATAQQIVVKHGGRLVIESEEGKGTEVAVFLPLPGAVDEAVRVAENLLQVLK